MWWTKVSEPPLAAVVIVAAVAAAFGPALAASFQFDDWNVIVRDPRVQSLAAWWAAMPGIRPLTKLSFALNHEWGGGVRAFRLVNLLIHAAATLGAFGLLRWLGGRAGWSRPLAGGAALTGALLFALHPVQTESVTYVSGRSGALAAALALGSALAFVHGRDGRRRSLYAGLSPLLFVLALGAKEFALLVPPALLLLGCIPPVATGAVPLAVRVRAAVRDSAVHWALLLVAAVIAASWPPYRSLLVAALGTRSVADNLLGQAGAIGYLTGQLLWPVALNADPALPVAAALTPAVIATTALIIGVLAGGLRLLAGRPLVAFGLLWFLLWLAPVNSVIPRLDLANDRQLYLPLLGPVWLLVYGGVTVARRWPAAQVPALTVAAGLLVTLGALTVVRAETYRDEIRFWSDVLAKSPANARAANNLGYAYAQGCDDRRAAAAFARAVALDPDYVKARVNQRLHASGALFPPPGPPCRAGR